MRAHVGHAAARRRSRRLTASSTSRSAAPPRSSSTRASPTSCSTRSSASPASRRPCGRSSAAITLALANKESLVAAGELAVAAHRRGGGLLLPVDSEHSALFQCLEGAIAETVEALVLTASGGPFRGRSRAELEHVTVADALAHPTWSMGRKITVDSATLANKGLELIEAHWLFGIPYDRIEVVVHPDVDRALARPLPRRCAARASRPAPTCACRSRSRSRYPERAAVAGRAARSRRRASTSGSRRPTARRSRCCRSPGRRGSAAARSRAPTTRRTRWRWPRSSRGGSASPRSPTPSPMRSSSVDGAPARDLDDLVAADAEARRARRAEARAGMTIFISIVGPRAARLRPRARPLRRVAGTPDAARGSSTSASRRRSSSARGTGSSTASG